MILWILYLSRFFIYLHSTLYLSSALDSIYFTLPLLDSIFIATLYLSSIIIYIFLAIISYRHTSLYGNPIKLVIFPYIRAFDHTNRSKGLYGNPEGNLKNCNFTSRSFTRPHQSPQRVAREPRGNLKRYNSTSRSRARPRQSIQRVTRHA